jgi:hypothetical protein
MFQSKAGNLRSPRKEAIKKGTEAAGFSAWDYDTHAGIPDRAMSAGQKYDDKSAGLSPVNAPAGAQRKPF